MTTTTNVGLKTLEDLFVRELEEIYDAEHRIGKLLSSVAKAACCWKLKKRILNHQLETESHVMKLERIFRCLDRRTTGKTGELMMTLVKEGGEITKEFCASRDIDPALISFLLKVERFEIQGYERLVEWAALLRNPDAGQLLEGILAEEIFAFQTLSELVCSSGDEQALEEEDMQGGRKAG